MDAVASSALDSAVSGGSAGDGGGKLTPVATARSGQDATRIIAPRYFFMCAAKLVSSGWNTRRSYLHHSYTPLVQLYCACYMMLLWGGNGLVVVEAWLGREAWLPAPLAACSLPSSRASDISYTACRKLLKPLRRRWRSAAMGAALSLSLLHSASEREEREQERKCSVSKIW